MFIVIKILLLLLKLNMVYDINCIIDFKYCYDNNNAIINIIYYRS